MVPIASKDKNITPLKVVIIESILIAVIVSAISVVAALLAGAKFSLYSFVVNFILILSVSYWINYLYLKRYIYRKIKLIYKIIRSHKLKDDSAEDIDLKKDIFLQVENEVSTWVSEKNKQLTDLKELEKYRRNYVGNISHELKTPIFNIQGYIHSLLDGAMYDEQLNLKFLKRAAVNVDRIQTIIEDLETISRLESGQLILDIRPFDLKILVDEVVEDLEQRRKEKNIKIHYKEGAVKNFRVNADRESIRQVLMNLILNSIKYGKQGGTTKIGFYDMENQILVEIADDGLGIDEPHLKHLFDRFYRVDKGRSRDVGGTGLGLSIVKHIIEAHQQTVNVRSTINLGSTFGFTLDKA
jgi:two-component system phosphate regulon sensor histidine kinase PhoR